MEVYMANEFVVEMLDIVKRFPTPEGGVVSAVDHVSLQVRDGEFFSLLGPSGCGKTTSLRMIAGFEMPTSGEIIIGGEYQGYLPANQRPVNTVFQQYALFPHMTIEENVGFGLEMRGISRLERQIRVEETLNMVRLLGTERRKPNQLSGGQQQRVALARALINKPKVLLLDEPLGALDLKLRKAMQIELKALQEQVGITFIYVTHDQEEALAMSDRIAVMSKGKVLQVGFPADIYEHPTNRFVANFIGETNFIPGAVENSGDPVRFSIAPDVVVPAVFAGERFPVGSNAVLSIRPEKIGIVRAEDDKAGRGKDAHAPGKIVDLVYLGTDTRYVVRIADKADVVVRMQNTTSSEHFFNAGDEVTVLWNHEHARVMEA
jgi:spermidine/putrescine transport system ATP-binding protein